jgi:hypothetical protein
MCALLLSQATPARASVAPAPSAVVVLLPTPVLAAILATAAPGQAEQRESGDRGEAYLEESLAAHTAPPLCRPGDVPLHRAYSMAMVGFAPGWLGWYGQAFVSPGVGVRLRRVADPSREGW